MIKKLLLIAFLLLVLTGCQGDKIKMSECWWTGETCGDMATMCIRFTSDTDFEFKSERIGNHVSYSDGNGRYERDGKKVVFDFETTSTFFTTSHIKLMSGEWNYYPESKDAFRAATLTVRYLYWVSADGVQTEPREYREVLRFTNR